jgi:hypothetical protein
MTTRASFTSIGTVQYGAPVLAALRRQLRDTLPDGAVRWTFGGHMSTTMSVAGRAQQMSTCPSVGSSSGSGA